MLPPAVARLSSADKEGIEKGLGWKKRFSTMTKPLPIRIIREIRGFFVIGRAYATEKPRISRIKKGLGWKLRILDFWEHEPEVQCH